MRGPDAQSYRPQFEHWLSLGASHRDAYERAGEIFALGRFLASQREEIEAETNDNACGAWLEMGGHCSQSPSCDWRRRMVREQTDAREIGRASCRERGCQ